MNFKIVAILLCVLMLASCAKIQESREEKKLQRMEVQREEALEFSLSVVQTYFDRDCDKLYEKLDSPLYSFGKNKLQSKNAVVKMILCNEIGSVVTGDHTYEEYLNDYDQKVLTKPQYDKEMPYLTRAKDFQPTNEDFLFVGSKRVNGEKDFIWDDFFLFVVRKTDENWKVSTLS